MHFKTILVSFMLISSLHSPTQETPLSVVLTKNNNCNKNIAAGVSSGSIKIWSHEKCSSNKVSTKSSDSGSGGSGSGGGVVSCFPEGLDDDGYFFYARVCGPDPKPVKPSPKKRSTPQISITEQLRSQLSTIQAPNPLFTTEPAGNWSLVNLPVIISSKATPTTKTINLLNTPITIKLTPTKWEYNPTTNPTQQNEYNNTITTTHQPRPHPYKDLTYTYHHRGTYQPKGTIYWQVTYQNPQTNQWQTIGTITSTQNIKPIHIKTAPTRQHNPNN